MSIDNRYKIPVDASANVHSVSAIGEQYLDLVSTGNPGQYLSSGQTITDSTVPSEVGPALDAANQGLAVLPKEKIDGLLTETANAVGGLGPALQRLVDSTTDRRAGLQGQPASGQRHHRPRGADPGQPGSVGRQHRAVGAQPEHHRLADRRAGRGAAQRPAAGRADPRSGQHGVQRCPRLAAADAGQPGRRHRHAQALQQGPRADVGDPAAGCRGRAGGHALRGRGPAAAGAVHQPAAALPDRASCRRPSGDRLPTRA